MITIRSVFGNIKADANLGSVYQKLERENKVEKILLSRMEAQRSRIRRNSDGGSDVAIILGKGSFLRHGDVLFFEENEKMIVVEYEPEDVLRFKIHDGLPDEQKTAVATKLGHMIGNLHRPISIKDNAVYMPIQSKSELANIKKILLPIVHYIDIEYAKIVFEPDEASGIHTH